MNTCTYVCVHTCTQRHMRRAHTTYDVFSRPSKLIAYFPLTTIGTHCFWCVLLLCFALLSVWGAMPKMLSYRSLSLPLSLSRAEMLRGEWVSCGGMSLTESGKEVNFVDKKGKRFSRCMSVLLLPCLSLVLSLFLLFVCAQLFSIVAISCFDSQTVKNLTTAATTTSNDNKTTVEKPHKC